MAKEDRKLEPFEAVSAVAVPLEQANIDTDQIIPARYLSLPRDEMAPHLFRDVRYHDDGAPRPEFVMNKPDYHGAEILVAERNFACGSSREMAVTVLQDNGFKVVIAPSFGDIFFNNCFQNGVLPIVLPAERCTAIREHLRRSPGARMTIDLEAQTVTGPDNHSARFEIDSFRKACLLEGMDDISMTLDHESAIAQFEARCGAKVGP
jgi:3-isopropylmalate/(R)-2-methylmalate dehydratase small subunit